MDPKGNIIWTSQIRKKTNHKVKRRSKSRIPRIHIPSLPKRDNRSKSRLKRKFLWLKYVGIFFRKYYKLFAFALIVVVIGVFAKLLFRTNYFEVKEIRFEGVEHIETEKLGQIAKGYKGKNIYSVNLTKLEKQVSSTSVYIKSVYARKELPNRLVIEVKERYPKYVILNLDGVYLIDKDYYVTAKPVTQITKFSDEEWEAYYTQNADLKIVEERVIANLKAEDKNFDEAKFDKATITPEQKSKVLKEIKQEVTQGIKTHFDKLNSVVNDSEYAGLRRIYIYDNGDFEEGDTAEARKMKTTNQIIDHFDTKEKYTISLIEWESKFTLNIYTVEKKEFVFGLNRDISKQLEALDIILNKLNSEGKKFKRIDLSPEIIAVK